MFEAGPRRSRPQARFHQIVAGAVVAVAGLAYLLALSAQTLPQPTVATVLLTLSPVLCLVALVVYVSRARVQREPPLRWAAAGVVVCFTAQTLQFISFPVVTPDGGVLGTNPTSSAALYLVFHLALFVAGMAGGLELPTRWARAFTWAGCLLALAIAADLVPLPALIVRDVVFTPFLRRFEVILTAVGVLAAILWTRRTGRTTTPLLGWFGIALAVASADVALNALTGERYDAAWWSSLSMRAATFALLATGALLHALAELRRLEGYSEAELSRRENQLATTGEATDVLMANAVGLARASTPADVAEILAQSISQLTGCERIAILEAGHRRGSLSTLTSRGYDADRAAALDATAGPRASPAGHVAAGGPSLYLSGHQRVLDRFPELARSPRHADVSRLAAVRMEAAGALSGAVIMCDDDARSWSTRDRAILEALVAQGGPALARARQQADEHQAAEVLQRSLLPTELRIPAGLSIAARYVPGDTRAGVGGDWYDCLTLPDGRVVLTVGDVMGKGVQAATIMGVLRQSVRVLASIDPSPASVLSHLDDVGLELGELAFATAIFVLWDPATQTATVARAGHLPPLLVGPAGEAMTVDGFLSTPIGVRIGDRTEGVIAVPPGTHLVLYTDGLVERRRSHLQDGIRAVMDATRHGIAAGVDLDSIADSLLATSAREDDIALLVIRFNESADDQRRGSARGL